MVWNAITSSDAISSARLFFRTRVGVSVGRPISNCLRSSSGIIVTIRSLSLPTSNVSSCNSSNFSRSSTNSRNFRLPINIDALGIVGGKVAEHQAQAAPNRLLGKDIRLRCVGPQANDNRYVLHVPTFTQHHDAHDGVNRVERIVNAFYRLPSRFQIFLAHLT